MSTKNSKPETRSRSLGIDFTKLTNLTGIYDDTKEFQLALLKDRKKLRQFVAEMVFQEFGYNTFKYYVFGYKIKKVDYNNYTIARGIAYKILKENFGYTTGDLAVKFTTKETTLTNYNRLYLNDILDVDKNVYEKYRSVLFKLKYYDLI